MNSSQKIFNNPQRKHLFQSLKMGWYDVCPIEEGTGIPLSEQTVPYALYHCQKIQRQTIQDIRDASVAVGKVLHRTYSIIKSLDHQTLLSYGFPAESIKLIQNDTLSPFCMRLDWCWNPETGVKKVIETNPQTPSFWFECHEGNDQVAQHFGYQAPVVNIQQILSFCLEQNIKEAAKIINKPVNDCNVVFTALNNAEDLGTMNWLSHHFYQKSTTIPLEFLRIQDGKYLFDQRNGKPIDILFMWYPIEWVINDLDENGQGLWTALEELILNQKIVVVNFASAFALQPKSVFALIHDLGLDFFNADEAETIINYFPKTSLNPADIGDTYFAKPILGREGEGGFAVKAGKIAFSSATKDDWYRQQQLVYQELLELPKFEIAEKMMTTVWGAWLYNNGDDEFIAGGLGMRVSDSEITDNLAYWCPIGCQ
jgi:glutathionylspermidine synthase